MRHIPEEELHAYLDQALSRSQCIEIESHLAICSPCRRERDAIAALRDRTTRLLGLAAPRLGRAPAWTELEGRALTRRQRPWRRSGLWAASIAAAVVAGWGLRTLSDPGALATPELAAGPVLAPIVAQEPPPVVDLALVPAVEPDPTPRYGADTEVRLASATRRPAPVAASPVESAGLDLADDGWSVVTLEAAETETGRLVPLIPEYPVETVRLRRLGGSNRPVLLVTQIDPSGTPIHTLEGPVAEVAQLVALRLRPGGLASSEPSRSPPDYADQNGLVRRTSRVLTVVGPLPADSLNALAGAVVMR